MRLLLTILFLFSFQAFSNDCVQLLLKLRDQEIVRLEREIHSLEVQYIELDQRWDRLDSQGLVAEQFDIATQMEAITKKIEELKKEIVYREEVLPGKEALLNRIRKLEQEARDR